VAPTLYFEPEEIDMRPANDSVRMMEPREGRAEQLQGAVRE